MTDASLDVQELVKWFKNQKDTYDKVKKMTSVSGSGLPTNLTDNGVCITHLL